MSHRINRERFLEVLGKVRAGVSTRDHIEQSTCVVFSGGWVSTYNDEICCRAAAGFPEEFEGAVRAVPLLGVLENMADEDVEVRFLEKEVRVRGARREASVRLERSILLPLEEIESPESWTPLPEGFPEAVKRVCETAGTDDDEFVTICVHVHPDYLESCDRKQATRFVMRTGIQSPCLVRAKSLRHVADLGLVKVGVSDGWIHFRNKGLIFSCRRHLDEYPTENVTKVMSFRGSKATLPESIPEAVRLAVVFSGEDKTNDKVLVRISEGRMEIRGEGAFGWSKADLEMSYRGDPLTFRIVPDTLIFLAENHRDCEITPGRLRIAGESWTYVTVLGREEASEAPPPEPEPAEVESEEAVAVGEGGDD